MSGCNTRFPSKINELDNIKNRCINLESDKDIIGKEIFKTESIAFTKNIAQKFLEKISKLKQELNGIKTDFEKYKLDALNKEYDNIFATCWIENVREHVVKIDKISKAKPTALTKPSDPNVELIEEIAAFRRKAPYELLKIDSENEKRAKDKTVTEEIASAIKDCERELGHATTLCIHSVIDAEKHHVEQVLKSYFDYLGRGGAKIYEYPKYSLFVTGDKQNKDQLPIKLRDIEGAESLYNISLRNLGFIKSWQGDGREHYEYELWKSP